MRGNVSIRRLLLSAVVILVLAGAVDADPLIIVIGPGENTFRFQNGRDTATATDFHVGILGSVPLPGGGIGGGSGGPPFPDWEELQSGRGGVKDSKTGSASE